MDIDELVNLINAERSTALEMSMNSGRVYELPPGTQAYDHGSDTLLILWPGDAPHKLRRSLYIGGVNVSSVEQINSSAG